MAHTKFLSIALLSLSLVSVWFTYSLYTYVQAVVHAPRLSALGKAHLPQRSEHSYSYVADDYPAVFPQLEDPESRVQMVVEESIHYSLLPEARDVWYSSFPLGVGTVTLGSHYRGFFVAMFHELHCLQTMRDVLVDLNPAISWGHLRHCVNYLRQRALCQADLTLEPGDFTKRDFAQDRTGATHVCGNWNALATKVDENWNNWVEFWQEFHNVTL